MKTHYFIILFQLFALVPHESTLSKRKKYLFTLNTCLSLVYPILIWFYTKYVFNYDSIKILVIFNLVFDILVWFLLFTHFCIIAHTFIARYEQNEILSTIDDIDMSIITNKLKFKTVYKHIGQKYAMKLFAVILLLILNHIYFIIFIEKKMSYALFLFSIILIRVHCIQFIFYVSLIEERLHVIDKNLMSMDRFINATNARIRINELIENECYNRIVTLKSIYSQLWEIATLLNACFGWSFLIIAIEYFVELVANGYIIFLCINPIDQLDESVLAICIGLLPAVFMFNVVCLFCHRCTNSVSL